jgi:hypothetical protein
LRNRFAGRAEREGFEPDDAVRALAGSTEAAAVDLFWDTADANMTARRIRLVFVADVIPPELLRIIEFLNESFVRAEVYGVEVRQFVGEGHQTLVPRVLGRTTTADQVKEASSGSRRARHWTPDTLRDEALVLGGEEAQRLVDSVIAWSARTAISPTVGVGKGGPIYIESSVADGKVKIASVNATGYVMWNFDSLARARPFDDPALRLECLRRLNAIPGVSIEERYATGATWPTIPAEALHSEVGLGAFYAVVDWTAEQLAATVSSPQGER